MVARSKKDLASDELEQGLSHVGKALSLLGGRTRALSVKNNQRVFTVRKYLESIEQRLRVCQDLLQLSTAPEGRLGDASTPEGRMQDEELTPTRFPIDVLSEQSCADRSWKWAERHGMERELYYALTEPWVTGTTIRLLYALLNSKITTRAQIIALGVDGLSRMRNLGPKGIAYIRDRLQRAQPGVFTTEDGAIVTDFTPSQLKEALDKANEQDQPEELRDDFERGYDSTREPGC